VFFVWVSLSNQVTQNGLVTFNFDGGSNISQIWDEISTFDALFAPGTNLSKKTLALTIAASRQMGFAWSEFNFGARATVFRVTGGSALINSQIALCPSNNLVGAGTNTDLSGAESSSFTSNRPKATSSLTDEQRARKASVSAPVTPETPLLQAWPRWEVPQQQLRVIKR
jgi:hypothetical protein